MWVYTLRHDYIRKIGAAELTITGPFFKKPQALPADGIQR
jgi:hypothetical protein